MKTSKPFNAMSKTALAAIIAGTAIVPAMAVPAQAAEATTLEDVIVTIDGQAYTFTFAEYVDFVSEDMISTTSVSHVKASTGKFYSVSDYVDFLSEYDSAEAALAELGKTDLAKDITPVEGEFDKDGNIIPPSASEDFEVVDIAAINKTGVTVNFPKLAAAIEGATVVVKNPAGDTVAVKAQDLAKDATEATFEFETALTEVTEGIWTVNGVEYNTDKTAPEVSEVTVTDYQTLTIALSEAVTGTPVVTVNGEDATGILSEDGKSVTVKKEVGYTAGTYTVSLSGLADASGNEMAATEATVTKAASTVESVTFVSEALNVNPAPTGGVAGTATTVNFKAVDQYGQEVTPVNNDLLLDAKFGTFPVANGVKNVANSFTIDNSALKDGRDIALTVYKMVEDERVEVGTKTLKVIAEDAKLTSIAGIKITAPEDTSDLKAGDTVTLKASVLDQFGNEATLKEGTVAPNDGDQLRWTTSDKSIVSFTGKTTTFVDGLDGSKEIGLTLGKEGKATVTAFLPDGSASNTFEITVGKGKVASIIATDAVLAGTDSVVNKKATTTNVFVNPTADSDEAAKPKLVFQNAKQTAVAPKADEVSFEVKGGAGFDAADVKVEKVVDAKGYLTGLKISTDRTALTTAEKAGNYATGTDYTVTVKSTVEGVADQTFKVTSKVDSKVTSITTQEAVTVRANNEVKQDLVFKNAQGEVINVQEDDVKLSKDAGIDVVKQKLVDEKLVAADPTTDVIAGLSLKSATKGSYQVLVSTGTVSKTVNVTVDSAATLTKIDLGADVTSGIVSSSTDLIYKPLSVTDQDGTEMTLEDTDLVAVAKIGEDEVDADSIKVGYYKTNEKGEFVTSNKQNAEGLALVIDPAGTDLTGLSKDTTVAVEVKGTGVGTTDKVSDTVNLKVQAEATLDKLAVTPVTGSSVVGASQVFKVTGLDQYGKAFDVAHGTIKVVGADNGEYSAVVEDGAKTGKEAKVTITGGKAGVHNVVIYKDADANGELGAKEKSITVPFTVKEIGDAIDTIAIQDTAEVTPNGLAKYTTDIAKNKVQVVKAGENVIKLSTKAFDADKTEVGIQDSQVLWSVSANNLKYADDSAVPNTALAIDNGELTFTAADKEVSGTLTVKATSLNGKVAEKTLTVTSQGAITDYYLSDTADGIDSEDASVVLDPLTSITLEEAEAHTVAGARTVNVISVDEFGKLGNVSENSGVTVSLDNSSKATINETADGIIFTATEAGPTTLRVFVGGSTIAVPFEVKADAVVAADKVKVAKYKDAANGTAIKTLLGTNELGLNVTAYNKLEDAAKIVVTDAMAVKKANFTTKEAIQTELNSQVAKIATDAEVAVKALFNDPTTMKSLKSGADTTAATTAVGLMTAGTAKTNLTAKLAIADKLIAEAVKVVNKNVANSVAEETVIEVVPALDGATGKVTAIKSGNLLDDETTTVLALAEDGTVTLANQVPSGDVGVATVVVTVTVTLATGETVTKDVNVEVAKQEA